MDYNTFLCTEIKVIFCGLLLHSGRCYEAEICAILFLLRCSLIWYHFLPKSNFSDFSQKPWTIIRRFYRNRSDFLRSFYSTVESAMKLKSDICAILFLMTCSFIWYHFLPKSKFSDFSQKPWTIIRRFYRNQGDFLRSFYSRVEGAMKLKLVLICSS